MVGLILAGMIWGVFRGVTWQLASLASLVLAYLFSYEVSLFIAPYIPARPAIQRAGSMLAAYIVMSAGVFFVAWTIRATLKKLKFEAYDRHLGMLLGGIEGALLGIVGTLFVVGLSPGSRDPIFSSVSGRVVARVMDSAGPVLPAEVRDVVTPFWSHVKNTPDAATVAAPEPPEDAPDDEPSLGSLARDAKSRITRAATDAAKDEIDRASFGDFARKAKDRITRAASDAARDELERLGESPAPRGRPRG